MLWQLVLVLLIIWVAQYRWSRRRIYRLSKQIKCDLPALPIIGHAYMFIGGGRDLMKTIKIMSRETNKQGGLTHVWIGPKCYIMIADLDILDVVLKTCLEKDDIMSFIRLGTGNGSIFAPVSIWRPRRKIVVPTFNQNNLNMFVDIFSKQSNIMVSLLKHAPKESFAIWDYITSYTMSSIIGTMFGHQINGKQKLNQLILNSIGICSYMISHRICKPWLHYLSVYKMTAHYATFMKHKEAIYSFVRQIIETKREAFKENHKDISNKNIDKKLKTFLDLVLEDEKQFTDSELQEEAFVLVFAGTDTSAVGASYTTVMLSRHQDVQEKVYQEVMDVLGDTDRPIVAEDLPRLKYLDAVMKETLRLHPPVSVVVRKVEGDVTLPSGITLVDGCGIVVNIWAVHRSPKYWGSDADEFRPERFFEYYDKRAFMAFSSGPRKCLGYQYAMMSMKTVLASLIRQYRVLPAVEDILLDGQDTKYRPIEETFELMTKDVHKFRVQLKRRN